MADYCALVSKQRSFFLSGGTRDLAGRKARVSAFLSLITENRQAIDEAIYADLRRRGGTEVDSTIGKTRHLLEHMDEWAAPKKLATPAPFSADTDSVLLVPEPLGVVLVIGPWNFPLSTTSPMAHALAAGNTVILKPSEMAAAYSRKIAELIPKYFKEEEVACVEGAIPETTALLRERFDHILYTGCPPVAKIVMTAAARHLTPVTLELGGKNFMVEKKSRDMDLERSNNKNGPLSYIPVFVDDSADLAVTAGAIVRAKLHNAGQICISADYLLVTPATKPKVIAALTAGFGGMGDLTKSEHFGRIINERHFHRLTALLAKTKGTVVYKSDGEANEGDKYIPITIVDVNSDDELMKDEIFGPILPIVTVASFEEALEFVRRNEKPLGAYIFTRSDEQATRWIAETSSGAVVVNDIMVQYAVENLPFGGVGNSGMGRIHGHFGFATFTHEKAVLARGGVKPQL